MFSRYKKPNQPEARPTGTAPVRAVNEGPAAVSSTAQKGFTMRRPTGATAPVAAQAS
jgi:hypothetical protein